jgi:PAS domain S-box-containing protein
MFTGMLKLFTKGDDTMLSNKREPFQWEDVFSSIHNGMIVVDRDRRITYMNEPAQKILQVAAGEWEGRDIQQLVPKTELPEVLTRGVSSIGQNIEIGGKQYLVNRTPLYQAGELIGAVSMIQDITEVAQYRSLLKQFEAIVESSTDGIYVVDGSGVTVYVNRAYEEITGFRREELVGHHMQGLIDLGYIDQSVSLLVLEQRKQVSIMQKIRGKKDVIVTGNPVFNEQEEIELVVTSVRDITQLNEMRKELVKAKTFSEMNRNRYSVKLDGLEDDIVFESERMKQIYRQVQQVAPFPTSILLTGPSGAGKEVVANLIHHLSKRKEQPFIKVNCGSIPEQLLESELFGYESGAFTGARSEGKIGLLELADGGTVMLDEIGEMPLAIQVKLLRVIQEKQILRIGGSEPRQLDIRIISATNRDLHQLINEGRFREDLFYRLQVVEIKIPPLVERQKDVALFVDYFFHSYCQLYHIDKQLAEETKRVLLSYPWPGNVRELKNLIENMVVSIPAERIEPYHLPIHITEHSRENSHSSLKQRVEQFEQHVVHEALKKSPSLRKAAQDLGIDHSTLVKKLQRWGWER